MDNEVKFRISIEDNGSQTLKTVGINADDLREAIANVHKEVEDLNPAVVNFAQLSQGIDAVTGVIDQLQGALGALTEMSQAQVEVETKLGVAMRNTMGATDEDIQAIKDLCSAQQELGIIGDEVQLAGAQELATYLEERESLEKLIPVLNDMTAQQYGFNATQESSAQIASMLGKVMEGQTAALSRYGYSFDEAQEQILKFGTESERAAVLADVVSQSVGGMNAALAQTDAGKQKQLENTLGDIQEQLGGLVQNMMPYVTGLATMADAAGGVMKLASAMGELNLRQNAAKLSGMALSAHQRVQAMAQQLLASSGYSAAAGTTALTVATTALYAAMTLGISVVVTALVALFSSLGEEAENAADGMDELKQAQDEYVSTSAKAKVEIESEISKLRDLITANADTTEAVNELNRKYGDSFGYHQNAQEWYDILISKSQAYCKQLGYEAQAKLLASQKAAKEIERDALQERITHLEESGQAKGTRSMAGPSGYTVSYEVESAEYAQAKIDLATLNGEVERLQGQFDQCTKKMQEAAQEMSAGNGEAAQSVTWQTMSYTDLGTAIEKQKKKVGELAGVNDELAKSEANTLRQMETRYQQLGGQFGLSGGRSGNTSKPSKTTPSNTPEPVAYDEGTLGAIEQRLKELREARANASGEYLEQINREMTALNAQAAALEKQGVAVTQVEAPTFEEGTLGHVIERLRELEQERLSAHGDYLKQINEEIAALQKQRRELSGEHIELSIKTEVEDTPMKKYRKTVQRVTEEHEIAIEGLKGMGSAMNSLGAMVGGAAGEWVTWGGNVLNAIASAIPQIMALASAETTEATANTAAAATGAASSMASIPYVGPILAVAAVASVLAALANLPKFANGAIAYGPTLGLFGEYAGASSNPEVVAPLNKLRDLIEPGGSDAPSLQGKVDFRIRGRRLEGVLEKEQRMRSRRGKS